MIRDDDTRRALSCVLWRNWLSGRDDEDCRVTACGHRAQKIMRSRGVGTQRHVWPRGTCRHPTHNRPESVFHPLPARRLCVAAPGVALVEGAPRPLLCHAAHPDLLPSQLAPNVHVIPVQVMGCCWGQPDPPEVAFDPVIGLSDKLKAGGVQVQGNAISGDGSILGDSPVLQVNPNNIPDPS